MKIKHNKIRIIKILNKRINKKKNKKIQYKIIKNLIKIILNKQIIKKILSNYNQIKLSKIKMYIFYKDFIQI